MPEVAESFHPMTIVLLLLPDTATDVSLCVMCGYVSEALLLTWALPPTRGTGDDRRDRAASRFLRRLSARRRRSSLRCCFGAHFRINARRPPPDSRALIAGSASSVQTGGPWASRTG